MTKPTVLILAETFVPPPEVYVYRRTKYLRELNPVVACFHRANQEAYPFAHVHELRPFSPNIVAKGVNFLLRRMGLIHWDDSLEGIHRFRNLICEVKPDLILCEGGYAAASLIDRVLNTGLPFAVTFWGTDINAAKSIPKYFRKLTKVFENGDMFIYCCNFLRRRGEDLGCPPENSVVINNGVEIPADPAWTPSPDGSFRLLSIARMSPVKGLDVLLRSVRRSLDSGVRVQLTHVGSGRMSKETHALAEELQLGEAVRFLGALPNDEALASCHQSDALVLSSVRCPNGDEETFPTVLLEAGAHGLPVIASDIGGVADIVRHEQTGLLVPEGDPEALAAAIRRLADSAEEAREFGMAGRRRVSQHFEVRSQVGAHESALLQLLEGAGH